MIAKVIEIRDRMTFIPVLAVQLGSALESERYLLARSGYGLASEDQERHVILTVLTDPNRSEYDPYSWPESSRTMRQAHLFLRDNFDDVASGSVVDVEFILGEKDRASISERLTAPL